MEQQETYGVTPRRVLSFHEIARMQDELNTKADPNNPDWIAARTPAQFSFAANAELVELAESIEKGEKGSLWKWWKKPASPDMWNVKIEIIDAVHFLVSRAILLGYPAPTIDTYPDAPTEQSNNLFLEDGKIDLNFLNQIMSHVTNADGSGCFGVIVALCHSVGMTLSEMSAIYLAKYTLNEIRYEGGYYAEEYAKYKEGVEDNELLEQVVKQYLEDESLAYSTVNNLVRNTITGVAAGPA